MGLREIGKIFTVPTILPQLILTRHLGVSYLQINSKFYTYEIKEVSMTLEISSKYEIPNFKYTVLNIVKYIVIQ